MAQCRILIAEYFSKVDEFHGDDLYNYVVNRIPNWNPRVDTILRELRRSRYTTTRYEIIGAHSNSHYKVLK